jgi:hypothetical protein
MKNPSNPYFKAHLEAWSRYSDAYHSDVGNLDALYKAYVKAKIDLDNNPQTIFNNE